VTKKKRGTGAAGEKRGSPDETATRLYWERGHEIEELSQYRVHAEEI
jgi:hypothetical protein